MTLFRKTLYLVGLAAIGFSTAPGLALADTGCGPMGAGPGKYAERIEKRQAALHDKLKLTAAQEPAWNAFIAASAPKLPAARPDRAALAQLSAPERAEKRHELHKQMLAHQETRLAALKTFYAQLTPEQQKTFDEATRRHHGRAGHHGGGHGRGTMHHG